MKSLQPTPTTIIVQMIKDGKLDPNAVSPIPLPSLSACLNELMGPSGLSATALAELASLHRSSVFRILSGETTPSRNVLLSLAVVLGLDLEETQTLLKCGECAPLSGSRPRDVLILEGLVKHKSLGEIDDTLKNQNLKGLIKS